MEAKKNAAPVTQEEVKIARNALKAQGKKVTYQAIRTALGDRGSFGTIGRHLAELENEEQLSSESPVAKEALGNVWAEVRRTVSKEFETRLAEQSERAGELEDEVVRLESVLSAQAKEFEEAVKREHATADALRKTLSELEVARAAQVIAEKAALDSSQAREAAQKYAGDLKGVLGAVEKALSELGASAGDDAAALRTEIGTYLSRLESVTPGQEARAVFLQILEADQARREFQRLSSEFGAERSRLSEDIKRLTADLATARTSLAVAEEARRSLTREVEMHRQNTDKAQLLCDESRSRIDDLQRDIQATQKAMLELERARSDELRKLHAQLQEALVRNASLEIEAKQLKPKE